MISQPSETNDVTEFFESIESQRNTYSTAYYDPDGDCIEFLAYPVNFYAKRVDDLVTVYYSEKDNEIVGSLIKGVAKLIKQPNWGIIIADGKIRLAHLFIAKFTNDKKELNQMVMNIYQKLIACAEKTHAEAEMCSSI